MHGISGIEKIETNAQGRILKVLERDSPVHGDDLILALDVQVQQAAWDALGDRPGAVVAIDPTDGSVLAMVSKPAFDPNLFVHGISSQDYSAILAAPGRPLFNRTLLGGYEPGSTLKPFLGLGGLELGVVTAQDEVFSSGAYYLPGVSRPFRDWKKGGHGWVNMLRSAGAVGQHLLSTNWPYDMGIDRMHDYLDQFGFGKPTGLDLLGENSGVLPSREWKRRPVRRTLVPR